MTQDQFLRRWLSLSLTSSFLLDILTGDSVPFVLSNRKTLFRSVLYKRLLNVLKVKQERERETSPFH